jgi:hypothetical protein
MKLTISFIIYEKLANLILFFIYCFYINVFELDQLLLKERENDSK